MIKAEKRMLNIGCGSVYFDGWINIDFDSPTADLLHDVTTPLPFADDSVDFIYNEHFIEHLTVEQGLAAMREFRRVLRPGGVLRIATPDLNYLMRKYFFFWKDQAWIRDHNYGHLQTRAEMINLCFHEWGHKYLYNEEELARRLREVGFAQLRVQKIKKSSYEQLKNRETRDDSRLIIEANK